jgi:3-hydroxyacyl-[acyl-carrier-protein] dehydratase
MGDHFSAFSFVDRITDLQPGVRIRGRYTVPSSLNEFPSSLAAEAIGQLAAWAAMASVEFQRRPVAGLAGCIRLLSPISPGQVLELAVELEGGDDDAIGYSGEASVDGRPVIRLEHCVGPMVLQEEFDCSRALKDRFELLRGPGATPGGFRGVPALQPERVNGEPGRCARANLQVPVSAPFFGDHFPRRPVFPGSLLVHSNLQLVFDLVSEVEPPARDRRWKVESVSNVKLRSFIPPGEKLEIEANLEERSANEAVIAVETRMGRRVVGAARIRLIPEHGQ